MNFQNNKKTFLDKLDRSKKGEIDERVIPIITGINKKENYFTTSSCSGRAVIWKGSGKKNETEWIKVSHDPIEKDFLDVQETGLTWLRVEPFIMHICCKTIEDAKILLNQAQQFFKKSSILSISNKIIIELKGSELMEVPLMKDDQYLFKDLALLRRLTNKKLEKNFNKLNSFSVSLEQGK